MEKNTDTISLEAERRRLRKELLRRIIQNELQRQGKTGSLVKSSGTPLQNAHS